MAQSIDLPSMSEANSNYLYNIQQSFGHSNADVLGLLLRIAVIVVPLLCILLLWKSRTELHFYCLKIIAQIRFPKQKKVLHHLLKNEKIIALHVATDSGLLGRKIATVCIDEANYNGVALQLLSSVPMPKDLTHQRVICLMRPLLFSGREINSFTTYISRFTRKETVIKEIEILPPLGYERRYRREHGRRKTGGNLDVRVKVWTMEQRKSFWMLRPHLQTVKKPSKKPWIKVGDISAAGAQLSIMNPEKEHHYKKDDRLILRISVKAKDAKRYSFFTVLGVVRSTRTTRQAVIMGLQFTKYGTQVGAGIEWGPLAKELDALTTLFERRDKKK